jgi:hypothetical protein
MPMMHLAHIEAPCADQARDYYAMKALNVKSFFSTEQMSQESHA